MTSQVYEIQLREGYEGWIAMQVITYRLAYLERTVDLCAECVESGEHGAGALGPVSHGQHWGACEGEPHGREQRARLAREMLALRPELHPAAVRRLIDSYGVRYLRDICAHDLVEELESL